VAVVDGSVLDNINKTEKKNGRYLVDCATGMGFSTFIIAKCRGRFEQASIRIRRGILAVKARERLRNVIVQTIVREQSAQIIKRIR
jgi:hypothetical protein